MKQLLVFTAVLATSVSGVALAAERQQLTLNVSGVFWGNCARALAAALGEGGLTLKDRLTPNQGKGPVKAVGEVAEKADLGKIAQAVNQAKTPHRSEAAPGLAVVLFADLDKDSAKAAVAALGKIKGVDGKGSQADPKKGELSVKIAGGEKVTVTNIVAALKNAGIETSTTKAKNWSPFVRSRRRNWPNDLTALFLSRRDLRGVLRCLWTLAELPKPAFVDGDFSLNGIVDAADYTIWANNFGMSVSSPDSTPAAVPESSTFLMAGLGLLCQGLYGCQRRKWRVAGE